MQGLEKYSLDKALVQETVDRIKSDFLPFGLDITYSGASETALEELRSQLIPFFEKLTTSNKSLLMRILYKIDISERMLEKAKKSVGKYESFSEMIALLVIEREFQKVITRRYFK